MRKVESIFKAIEKKMGSMGNIVLRCVEFQYHHKILDPFLLLDEAKIGPDGGFPDHPHRGFQAVSYLMAGEDIHEDCHGHKGIIKEGGHMWMNAGKGILHSEKPIVGQNGIYWGTQLWINIPKKLKTSEPGYVILSEESTPKVSKNGVHVKILCGESMGSKSSFNNIVPVYYLDFKLEPQASHTQELPKEWNSFIYILTGTGKFGPDAEQVEGTPGHTLILSKGESIFFKNAGSTELRFLLLAGEPLNEPATMGGPFVMNTQEEIDATYQDYKNGKNGFEKAIGWQSTFAKEVIEKRKQ